MKKIITLLLLSFMLFNVMPVSANAIENAGIYNEVEQKIYFLEGKIVNIKSDISLQDINFNYSYTLFEFEEGGYAIMANKSKLISEYCLQAETEIPYRNADIGSVLIYGGPFNYLSKTSNGVFKDTSTNIIIEFQPSNELKIKNLNFTESKFVSNSSNLLRAIPTSWTGIQSSRFKRYNAGMWLNTTSNYPYYIKGICGQISSAIMLAYFQDYINSSYVPNTIRTRNSTSPGTLISKMVSYMGGTATGTIPTDWKLGLNAYFNDYGISNVSATSTLLGTWTTVKNNIDSGKPLVVGMTNIAGSPYGDHAVTVYAYATDSNGKGYYRCIDNWGNFDKAIETSWTIGASWLY